MQIERSLGKSLLAVVADYLLKIGRGSAAAFSARKTAVLPLFAGDEKKQRCAAAEKAAALLRLQSSLLILSCIIVFILIIALQFTKEVRELHKRKINFIVLYFAQTNYQDLSNIEAIA